MRRGGVVAYVLLMERRENEEETKASKKHRPGFAKRCDKRRKIRKKLRGS